jgi:hypothetical protein
MVTAGSEREAQGCAALRHVEQGIEATKLHHRPTGPVSATRTFSTRLDLTLEGKVKRSSR